MELVGDCILCIQALWLSTYEKMCRECLVALALHGLRDEQMLVGLAWETDVC